MKHTLTIIPPDKSNPAFRWFVSFAGKNIGNGEAPTHPAARVAGTNFKQAARTWSDTDQYAAMREGWAIFNRDTLPEIQRDDEAGIFVSDRAAKIHVRKQANLGSALHSKALKYTKS